VVALPVGWPGAAYGVTNYCSSYNAFVIKLADSMALQGRWGNAREMYQLVARFDPQREVKQEIAQKLALITELENGNDVERQLKAFKRLCTDYSPLLNLRNALNFL
jgi:hypothetical protein